LYLAAITSPRIKLPIPKVKRAKPIWPMRNRMKYFRSPLKRGGKHPKKKQVQLHPEYADFIAPPGCIIGILNAMRFSCFVHKRVSKNNPFCQWGRLHENMNGSQFIAHIPRPSDFKSRKEDVFETHNSANVL
jgi:hypothetical protein